MSLVFCSNIQMVGSEFDIKAWIHGSGCWCRNHYFKSASFHMFTQVIHTLLIVEVLVIFDVQGDK